MAVNNTEEESIVIYSGSSYFKDIKRKDGLPFESNEIATFQVFNNLNESIDNGSIEKSDDSMYFNLRYVNTTDWIRDKKYTMIIRLKNIDTGYNDVVLETTFTVR